MNTCGQECDMGNRAHVMKAHQGSNLYCIIMLKACRSHPLLTLTNVPIKEDREPESLLELKSLQRQEQRIQRNSIDCKQTATD